MDILHLPDRTQIARAEREMDKKGEGGGRPGERKREREGEVERE